MIRNGPSTVPLACLDEAEMSQACNAKPPILLASTLSLSEFFLAFYCATVDILCEMSLSRGFSTNVFSMLSQINKTTLNRCIVVV